MLTRCPDKVVIPKRVIINGMIEVIEEKKYYTNAKKAYLFEPEIICINEKNECSLEGLTDEDKGVYLALNQIYLKGGIYLSPYLEVTSSFNSECYEDCFFLFEDNLLVSMVAFGARPEHPLIKKIINAIEKQNTRNERKSVKTIISNVILREIGEFSEGRKEFQLFFVKFIPVSEVMNGITNPSAFGYLSYNNVSFNQEHCVSTICIDFSEYKSMMDALYINDKNYEQYRKDSQDLKKIIGWYEQYKKDSQELTRILGTKTYRFSQKVFKISQALKRMLHIQKFF